MAIEVSCRKCGKEYRVREERAGTKIRCKECDATISVPLVETEEYAEGFQADSYAAVEEDPWASAPARPRGTKSGGRLKTNGRVSLAGFPADHPVHSPVWLNWARLAGCSIGGLAAIWGVVALVSLILSDLGSRSWPEAQMTVTNIVREFESGRVSKHVVYVSFTFAVDGQTFERKRHMVDSDVVASNLDPVLSRYAVGTIHPVFYNPKSPDRAPQIVRGGNIGTHLFGFVIVSALAVMCPITAFRTWQVLRMQSAV